MTAICGGNTSSVKADVEEILIYTSGAAGILALYPSLRWLAAIASGMGIVSYEAATLCATDPPGFPTFTTSEVVNFLINNPNDDYRSFVNKAGQAIQTALWYQVCKCDVGSQPTAPTPPADPGGYTVTGPGNSEIVACQTFTSPDVPNDDGFGNGTLILGNENAGHGNPGLILPTGATSMVLTATNVVSGALPGPLTFQVYVMSGPGTFTSAPPTWTAPSGQTVSITRAIPPGTLGLGAAVFRANYPTAGSNKGRLKIDIFCGGQPGQLVTPCCPPDPKLELLLMRVIDTVTLIQRQAVPFAYVYGANHTGLTGDGELSVADLVGISVDVTTLPGYTGIRAGTPQKLFDVGVVALGTADGWTSTRSIDADGTLVLPTSAGVFTRIGYTLNPDVVVSIRELVREP